jgi:transposase
VPLTQTTLLATIPGIGERAAQVIISEIGVDMTRFPTAAHLASWAGLCPGNNESAGKHRSGKTRKGSNRFRPVTTPITVRRARVGDVRRIKDLVDRERQKTIRDWYIVTVPDPRLDFLGPTSSNPTTPPPTA